MNSGDLKPNTFFTTDGKDIWKLDGFYITPSCDMKNLETGQVENFGMEGLTAERFHRIEMPIEPKDEG